MNKDTYFSHQNQHNKMMNSLQDARDEALYQCNKYRYDPFMFDIQSQYLKIFEDLIKFYGNENELCGKA